MIGVLASKPERRGICKREWILSEEDQRLQLIHSIVEPNTCVHEGYV